MLLESQCPNKQEKKKEKKRQRKTEKKNKKNASHLPLCDTPFGLSEPLVPSPLPGPWADVFVYGAESKPAAAEDTEDSLSTRIDSLLLSQSSQVDECATLFTRLEKIGVIRDSTILKKITACNVALARAKDGDTSIKLRTESEISEALCNIVSDIMSTSAINAPKLQVHTSNTPLSQVSSAQGSPSSKDIHACTHSTSSAASSDADGSIRSLESISATCGA